MGIGLVQGSLGEDKFSLIEVPTLEISSSSAANASGPDCRCAISCQTT